MKFSNLIHNLKNTNFQNGEAIIIPLIIALGFYFRFYHWETYSLGFDQVQILKAAESIKSGHLTLIGPRTGPAEMFTGPLIFYIAALFLLIIPSPYAIVATSLCIYVLTAVGLYLLVKKYLSPSLLIPILTLYAASPFLISLDRNPWNPNLSLLAGSLVFFPLLGMVQDKCITLKRCLVICMGIFLGYQAHFSGLLLPLLAIFSLFFLIRKRIWVSILFILSFILSLLPTIYFDSRHDFLNYHGLLNLLHNKTTNYQALLFSNLLTNVLMTIENMGRFIFEGNNRYLTIYSGVVMLFAFFIFTIVRTKRRMQLDLIFTLLWMISFIVAFIVYHGSIPDYYYLMQFPAVLYIFGILVTQVLKLEKLNYVVCLAFLCYGCASTLTVYAKSNGISLGHQIAVNSYINQTLSDFPVKKFEYDMLATDAEGFNYLLTDTPSSSNGYIYHLAYPHSNMDIASHCSGKVCVWIDPRVNSNKTYVELKEYIIQMPQTYQLLQNYSSSSVVPDSKVFNLFIDTNPWGLFLVTEPDKFKNNYPEQYAILNENQGSYVQVNIQDRMIFGRIDNNRITFLVPDNEIAKSEVNAVGKEIYFYNGKMN